MSELSRRQFLCRTGVGALSMALAARLNGAEPAPPPFTLPKLPYDYDALEPHIDAETMKIHHDLHHAAYVSGLNTALKGNEDAARKGLVDLLQQIDRLPPEIRQAVINMGGGHANHTLFWEIMAAKPGRPSAALLRAIDERFGSQDKLQTQMSEAALKRFGSGWAWLVVKDGKLEVISSANQDSPLMSKHTPILGLDVWEHAYYLKYRNRRADYVKAWWNVVNWEAVSVRHQQAVKS